MALGLAIGLPVGWLVAGHEDAKLIRNFATAGNANDIVDTFSTLRSLRRGDTNEAIDVLEGHLDGAILERGIMARDEPSVIRQPGRVSMLARVRDYRAQYPRVSDPEVDHFIADVLSTVGTNNIR